MTSQGTTAPIALGFLTVVVHPQHGLFGGYLVLNATGRPLEFHCTAGVQASRAQEILFGPTLEDYLYGELIGKTLYEKGTVEPLLICTNQRPMLALRDAISVPVAMIEQEVPEQAGTPYGGATNMLRLDPPHADELNMFSVGRNRLAVAAARADDRRWIEERLSQSLDLSEPFARIQAAIEEAQRGAQ